MKCMNGDVWESATPLTTTQYYFQYKYSIWKDNGKERVNWEIGVDRLADLELMPDQQSVKSGGSGGQFGTFYGSSTDMYSGSSSGTKKITYYDQYEKYKMCFTIWHPDDDFKEEWMFENNKGIDY